MKHNLAKFPKAEPDKADEVWIKEVFDWLEGIKKELPELFSTVPYRACFPNDQFYINALESWILNVELQILGEA